METELRESQGTLPVIASTSPGPAGCRPPGLGLRRCVPPLQMPSGSGSCFWRTAPSFWPRGSLTSQPGAAPAPSAAPAPAAPPAAAPAPAVPPASWPPLPFADAPAPPPPFSFAAAPGVAALPPPVNAEQGQGLRPGPGWGGWREAAPSLQPGGPEGSETVRGSARVTPRHAPLNHYHLPEKASCDNLVGYRLEPNALAG